MCLRESDGAGSGGVEICKLEPIVAESRVTARVKECWCRDADRNNRRTSRKRSLLSQPCNFPLLPPKGRT